MHAVSVPFTWTVRFRHPWCLFEYVLSIMACMFSVVLVQRISRSDLFAHNLAWFFF
jgi:hypothetical protein